MTFDSNKAASAGIWIIDPHGNTKFVSQRMAEILGESKEALERGNSFDYIYPEDMDAARRLHQAKHKGDLNPYRFRLRRADGSPVWVEVQGTPLFEDGKMSVVVGTFQVVEG